MELPSILTKSMGGLPAWAWGLTILAGLGVGYYFVQQQQSAVAAVPTTSPELVPTPVGAAAGTDTSIPASALPSVTVGGSQVPYLPPGVGAIFDANGNVIGYQQGASGIPPSAIPPTPTPTPLPEPTPTPTPTAGGTYTVRKGDTIASIAAKLGVDSNHIWQSNRYTICQAMKHHKLPCNYQRGPMPGGLQVYQGTTLHY